LGASEYYAMHNATGTTVPRVDFRKNFALYRKLETAIKRGIPSSCHDCSEGGLAVALSEMAFAGAKGLEFELASVQKEAGMTDAEILFSESNSRFIVEVAVNNSKEFERHFSSLPFSKAGAVSKGKNLVIKLNGKQLIRENIAELRKAWQKTLSW